MSDMAWRKGVLLSPGLVPLASPLDGVTVPLTIPICVKLGPTCTRVFHGCVVSVTVFWCPVHPCYGSIMSLSPIHHPIRRRCWRRSATNSLGAIGPGFSLDKGSVVCACCKAFYIQSVLRWINFHGTGKLKMLGA